MSEAPTQERPGGERREKVRVGREELSEAEMERLAQYFASAIKAIDDLGLIPPENRPTLEESISGAGLSEQEKQDLIANERAEVEATRAQHRKEEAKRGETPAQKHLRESMSLFAEIVVLVTSVKREGYRRSFRWLGRNTISMKTHEKIDFGGFGDGIVTHEPARIGKRLIGSFRYDVGTGFTSLFKKHSRNLRQADQGYLADVPNVNLKELGLVGATAQALPYVTIALGMPTLISMADKFLTLKRAQGDTPAWEKAWSAIEYDPAQLMILNQLEAQFAMYVERGKSAAEKYRSQREMLEERLATLAKGSTTARQASKRHWPAVLDNAYKGPREAGARKRMEDLLAKAPSGSEVNQIMDELRRLALARERAPEINEKMFHEREAIREIRLERARAIQEMNPEGLSFRPNDPQHILLMTLAQGDPKDPKLRDDLAALRGSDW